MDIPIIDRVFGVESGVVLNFSNLTFAAFFHEEFGVDIYDDRWAARGNSKANRLRCYLQRADRHMGMVHHAHAAEQKPLDGLLIPPWGWFTHFRARKRRARFEILTPHGDGLLARIFHEVWGFPGLARFSAPALG